jgi:GT2 family glycosyltransferase
VTFGCVVLTTGRRPEVLALALESLERQRGVELDTIVVFNGAEPPPGIRGLGLPRDDGIPAARNDPRLGAVQLGVAPRGGGAYSRDWVPRLRVGDRTRPSDVAVLWEGALAVRRSVFDEVGGWPAEFRFVHEGVDLAWRILDAGHRVHYAGDIVALHPPPAPVAAGERHAYSAYYGARNRVWLARRHLPLPLGALFAASFAARTLPRVNARAALRGYRDGLRGPYPERRKLRARTLWRMARVGRPPVI